MGLRGYRRLVRTAGRCRNNQTHDVAEVSDYHQSLIPTTIVNLIIIYRKLGDMSLLSWNQPPPVATVPR